MYRRLPGPAPYAEVHALQQDLVDQRVRGQIPDTVLLVEHTETITVGRARGAAHNVLAPGDVPVVSVERGGDVTWHGPGQLVAYPIVALTGARADLHDHLHRLEDAVIGLLAELGLAGVRDPRNTGVWLANPPGPARKVAAIGIACRRWVTWHGLALNVCPDPAAFARIRPCGFEPDTVTRVVDALDPAAGRSATVDSLAWPLARQLARALALTPP